MPPKKNKQTSRNAFWHFMVHYKEQHGRNMNMKEAADAAGPHWERMNKEQKKPFEEKAMMERNGCRSVKLTSEGLAVEDLERQDREEQARIQEMKDNINYNLKLSSETGRIQDEMFFIIHINMFCYCASQDQYYPAEIAVSCFSLEDGVLPQNIFHRIIHPGALPLGYASEAKMISERSHQLPPPLAGDYDSNMLEVYNDLKHFLSTKLLGSKRFPPLYTDEKMIKMTQHILDTWSYDFDDNSNPLFKVYNLQYMFRVLKNIVANDTVWPTDTYSIREIEKDSYSYTNGICCTFHEASDVFVHCSRSVVVRYAYIICDNCCQDMNIILVPGTHIPDTAMNPNRGSRSSSRASLLSGSSRASSLKPSIREDDSDSVISFSSRSEWDNQSQISDSSALSLDSDSFPGLNFKKKSATSNSQPNFSSNQSVLSQSSTRSYAGAMGTSGLSKRTADKPSSISNDFEDEPRNEFVAVKAHSFNNDVKDFPALGKGRGVGRKMKF